MFQPFGYFPIDDPLGKALDNSRLAHTCLANQYRVVFGAALQYLHHFATERNVRRGARNLKSLWMVDLLLLHHNWHLRHHMYPIVPWIHLPHLEGGVDEPRGSVVLAYLAMWRGPRFSEERVRNHYAGRIIA